MRWTSKREQQRRKRKAELLWGTGFIIAMGVAGWALSGTGGAGGDALGEFEVDEYSPVEHVDVPVAAPTYAEQYAAPDFSKLTGSSNADDEYADEELDVTPSPVEMEQATDATLDVPVATTSAAVSTQTRAPTRTKVRSRRNNNLYSGCSSSQLLTSLKRATIRADGASRSNYTQPAGLDVNDLPPLDSFTFSYDLPDCGQPHVFTPAETCDLLGAFGGVYIRGDSLMRQFAQGLFLLLRNSFDIVREDAKEGCEGNEVFTNGRQCKFVSVFDSAKLAHSVCGEEAHVLYDQARPPLPRWCHPPGS